VTEAAAPAPSAGPSRSQGLLLAAAIVGFGFIGSRLLGILRTVAIANAFGSSPQLDAYNVAFRIPDLIFQVLAGATLGSAFIPVFARLYRREGEERAWRLASTMLNLVTAGTALLCLVALILAPWLVPFLAPGLGQDIGQQHELTAKAVSLTRLMLLSPFLFAVSGMVTGILNARQRFLLPAFAPMLYNLAIIFGALVLAKRWGVEGLATGVVVGAALHLLVQLPGLFQERMRFRFSFDWKDPAVREVGKLMGPRVIGLAATQVNFLVNIYFGSKVASSAISDLNYAWLLAQLPLAIFGMAISTAVFPRLADHAAEGEHEMMHRAVSHALRVIMFLTIPAALGLAFLREPITTILLQRGEFGAAETAVTAGALGFFCLGIVPMAGIEIHSRGFYALGDTLTPVIFALGSVGLNLGLSAYLYADHGTNGLAFADGSAALFEWVALYFCFNLKAGGTARDELRAIGTFLLCGATMTLFLAIALQPLDQSGRADTVIYGIAGVIAGGAVYIGTARFLGVRELDAAFGQVQALLGRGRRDA
jgi:putative peptidoglycan lipid II flippase